MYSNFEIISNIGTRALSEDEIQEVLCISCGEVFVVNWIDNINTGEGLEEIVCPRCGICENADYNFKGPYNGTF